MSSSNSSKVETTDASSKVTMFGSVKEDLDRFNEVFQASHASGISPPRSREGSQHFVPPHVPTPLDYDHSAPAYVSSPASIATNEGKVGTLTCMVLGALTSRRALSCRLFLTSAVIYRCQWRSREKEDVSCTFCPVPTRVSARSACHHRARCPSILGVRPSGLRLGRTGPVSTRPCSLSPIPAQFLGP